MQNIFFDTRKLDESCRDAYGLTEEIMMENAAAALEKAVLERGRFDADKSRVLIFCGGGNNGADGYALARRIRMSCDVVVFECEPPKTPLCVAQKARAEKCGTRFFTLYDFTLEFVESAAVIVDCIYGSGFHGELSENIQILLNDANGVSALRIACDVPSGIDADGNVSFGAFKADVTVTMGALKLCLFHDLTKDFVGEIVCADLGVGRRLFENSSNFPLKVATLLEEGDMLLPHRTKFCVNKANFGHSAVVMGEKTGAALISGSAALSFGAGLVTLVDFSAESREELVPAELMYSAEFPEKTTSLAFGMGLGRGEEAEKVLETCFNFLLENPEIPAVIDADAFYSEKTAEFLSKRSRKIVLTPHPKEFQSLLKICGIGEFSMNDCIMKRPKLVEEFCKKYPKAVLLAKGANPMIGYHDGRKFSLFVNPYGLPCLAKAGSGDVLSGLVSALQAQRYKCADAAGTASLAHAFASHRIKNDFAMTPHELIRCVTEL